MNDVLNTVQVVDARSGAQVRAFDTAMDLTLNEEGIICDCELNCVEPLGYRRSDLAWQHISLLLPALAGIKLMVGDKINPRLRFLSHIGYRFQLMGQGGMNFLGELFIRDIERAGKRYLRALIFPVIEGQDLDAMSMA